MDAPVITTKDCSRCNGSGSYSFNLRDGTRCYGCGGTGKVACAPKGQKKIKPDCTDINKAQVGQIVLHASVLYRVEDIKWTRVTHKGFSSFNQRARITRLVDGKELFLKREFMGYDPESGGDSIYYEQGFRETGKTFIHTPEHLIGTDYDSSQYDENCKIVQPLTQKEIDDYHQREALWA